MGIAEKEAEQAYLKHLKAQAYDLIRVTEQAQQTLARTNQEIIQIENAHKARAATPENASEAAVAQDASESAS